ncbi:MAG: DNA repair protein RecO [Spirosomataceae bacterium]
MLHKTRGIVIGAIPYRETSVIVKIFTEQFGLQSYIENGVRSSKGRNKMALFQPITLLDLVVYHKERGGIQRLAEIRVGRPYLSIPFDVAKSGIALFLTEVMNKSLKEETGHEPLFTFLWESFSWLDEVAGHFEGFHLVFLLKLSFFLGFAPLSANEVAEQLQEYKVLIDKNLRDSLDEFIDSEYAATPRIDRSIRNQLVDVVLKFYQLHIADFGEIKSLAVLKEVMR